MRTSTTILLSLVLSAATAQPQVIRYWSGALRPDAIQVNVQVNAPTDSLRVLVDDDPLFGSPIASAFTHTDSSTWCMVPVEVSGLSPATAYQYRFEVNGVIDTSTAHVGSFRTPQPGAMNFSFIAGSCNQSPGHPVWQAMQAMDPLFLLETGDLHYGDPSDTTLDDHRNDLQSLVLDSAPAANFLHHIPIDYTWDDHDFCGDGSTAIAAGRLAAYKVYREYVPHYPLAQAQDSMPIYHAFTIGRVRFIVCDMRSTKTAEHMMDSAQHSWLRHELVQAKQDGQLAVWVTSLSWNPIGYPENWGSAEQERRELSNFLRDHGIRNMLIICGDAHMLAIDSGTNGDFSTGANNPWHYPVFQAAAINRAGSYKGGVYDQGGYFPNPDLAHGQFGVVNVNDDGSQICVTLEGWRTDSMSAIVSLVNSYTFCRSPVDLGGADRPAARDGLGASWAEGEWMLTWDTAAGPGEVTVLDATGRTVWKDEVAWFDGFCRMKAGPLTMGAYVIRATNAGRATMVKTGNW